MELPFQPIKTTKGRAFQKSGRSNSYTVINESLKNPQTLPKAYLKPCEFLESIALEQNDGKKPDTHTSSKVDEEANFTFNPDNRRKKTKSVFNPNEFSKQEMIPNSIYSQMFNNSQKLKNKENIYKEGGSKLYPSSKHFHQNINQSDHLNNNIYYRMYSKTLRPSKENVIPKSAPNQHNLKSKNFPSTSGVKVSSFFSGGKEEPGKGKIEVVNGLTMKVKESSTYRSRLQSGSKNVVSGKFLA